MAASSQFGSDFNLDFKDVIPTRFGDKIKWVVIVVGLVVLFLLLGLARSIYTDLLWFGELGYRAVFLKILLTRIVLFIAGASIFALPVGVSLYFANRLSRGPEELPLPQATRAFMKRLIFWGTIAAAIVLSVIFGALAASQWEVFLRFGSAISFGATDPVYHKDLSFFVFSLPLYDFVQGWLLGAAIVILLASLGLYFVNFSFRGVGISITPGLKVHISIIAALIMMILGLGHWLDRWSLLLSDGGVVFGATYTDLNARQPALLILTIIAFASGILILINGYMRGIRLLAGGVALWVVMSIALGVVWPNAMQRLTVNPNELAKEQTFIGRNIEFTRLGYGLDGIVEKPYPAAPSLSAELISQNLQTINNIRLWDSIPLTDVYRFEQVIRPYYDFGEADVDRYVVDGQYRQVMLAAREVAIEKLAPEVQTWINRKLVYTHGFGVAMSPVTEFTAKGRPEFFAKDIPSDGIIVVQSESAVGEPETVITNPRIYYGENTTDYVIVNTNTPELDYQAEEEVSPRSIQYFGAGGVSLRSTLRRAAYAWQFGDVNILITSEITGSSRIQYRREIQDRISTVAPFLRLDDDPYIVAADGGLFWIQDAYTTSDHFPYSDPVTETGGFNYIRNSVKVTVDAFDGTVKLYVVDPSDPLVQTYRKIFPSLFLPIEELSPTLATHLRYPQDLFGFQASKYLKYHMLIPENFYKEEDIWSIPNEKTGQGSGELQPVDPYYVIMKLPGEEREEFVLLLPYTRNEPQPVMAGWLAARNDGEVYGQLVAFNFPKGRRVKGPEQIEADIDTDEDIKEWFTLKCQVGSFCIRGNLLVVPIAAEGTFGLLYAEPIYLQAEDVVFPALKKVILATDEKVVMEDSIPEAVAALTGFTGMAATAPVDGGPPQSDEAVAPTEPVQSGIETLDKAIEELQKSLSTLQEALQSLKGELAGGE